MVRWPLPRLHQQPWSCAFLDLGAQLLLWKVDGQAPLGDYDVERRAKVGAHVAPIVLARQVGSRERGVRMLYRHVVIHILPLRVHIAHDHAMSVEDPAIGGSRVHLVLNLTDLLRMDCRHGADKHRLTRQHALCQGEYLHVCHVWERCSFGVGPKRLQPGLGPRYGRLVAW